MQALNITLDDAICEERNSVRLSRLERAVKPILASMAVSARSATLSPASQKLLATWAAKTVLLLELAFRQMYPGSRPVEGYQASQPEFAWLGQERAASPYFRLAGLLGLPAAWAPHPVVDALGSSHTYTSRG